MTTRRVLLIDDDQKAIETLRSYLIAEAELDVDSFSSGREALEHLRTAGEDYTAVLLEYVLSPEDVAGYQVLAEIRASYPQLPVIVFTGRDPAGAVHSLSRGAYYYMRKPLDRLKLVGIIEGIAEQEASFRSMARDVRQMLGSDLCVVWRLDRPAHRLQIVAWDGDENLDAYYRRATFLDLDGPATRSFFATAKPIFLRDVKDPMSAPSYRHHEYASSQGWTSLISTPLARQGRIIGLIDSYTRRRLADKKMLEYWLKVSLPRFAHEAAGAVWNAELSTQLQTLQGLNEVLAGTFDVHTTLQAILAKGIELIGAEAGSIYRLDSNKMKLVLQDGIGVAHDLIDRELDLREGISGWVARTREGRIFTAATLLSLGIQRRESAGFAAESVLAVPLRRGQQIVGVLTVASSQADAFTWEDASLLTSLAALIAVAIGRADVTRHSQELGRLELSRDFDQMINYAVAVARDLTDADVILWTMPNKREEKGQWLQALAGKGRFDADYLAKARIPAMPESSLTALAIQQRMPLIRKDIEDVAEAPGEPRFYNMVAAKKYSWRGFMAVPLLGSGGGPLGSLNLYGRETAEFAETEVSLMQALANQIVAAFENAGSLSRLESLREIGNAIVRERAVHEILQYIIRYAIDLTSADSGVIYLISEDRKQVTRAFQYPPRARHPKPNLDAATGEIAVSAVIEQDGWIGLVLRDQNRSIFEIPLRYGGRLLGVLYLAPGSQYGFSDNEVAFLSALPGLVTLAIRHAGLC